MEHRGKEAEHARAQDNLREGGREGRMGGERGGGKIFFWPVSQQSRANQNHFSPLAPPQNLLQRPPATTPLLIAASLLLDPSSASFISPLVVYCCKIIQDSPCLLQAKFRRGSRLPEERLRLSRNRSGPTERP